MAKPGKKQDYGDDWEEKAACCRRFLQNSGGVVGVDPSTQGRYTAMWVHLEGVTRVRCLGDIGVASYVAIELPGKVYSRASAALILECSATAGAIAGAITRRYGSSVTCIYPEDWREWLTGKRSAKNKEIRAALVRMGFAQPRKGNNHEMDAIGVALYLAWSLDTGRGKSNAWLSPPCLRDYVPVKKSTARSTQPKRAPRTG